MQTQVCVTGVAAKVKDVRCCQMQHCTTVCAWIMSSKCQSSWSLMSKHHVAWCCLWWAPVSTNLLPSVYSLQATSQFAAFVFKNQPKSSITCKPKNAQSWGEQRAQVLMKNMRTGGIESQVTHTPITQCGLAFEIHQSTGCLSSCGAGVPPHKHSNPYQRMCQWDHKATADTGRLPELWAKQAAQDHPRILHCDHLAIKCLVTGTVDDMLVIPHGTEPLNYIKAFVTWLYAVYKLSVAATIMIKSAQMSSYTTFCKFAGFH